MGYDEDTRQVAAEAKFLSNDEAREATENEHSMSLWQSVKLYPKAVAWSMFFSLGTIMTAFDPQLLGNLFAVPKFQQDFGYLYQGQWTISAAWETGLTMGNPIGQVLGALFAAYPMEWYGRKKAFAFFAFFTGAFIFIQFFARSLPVLLVGELLGGLVLGAMPVIAPAYASEVCPVVLRGVLTSYVNLSFVTGQLIANGVIAGTESLNTHWAYSGPFAAQWVWVLIILVALPFAPESPYWLVRKRRFEEAERSLKKLTTKDTDVRPTLAMIIETDRLEQELESGSTYWDCFKGTNLRRTEISIGVYSIQNLSGIYLLGYTSLFYEIIGLSDKEAFDMSVVFLAIGWIGTLFSWLLMQRFGRRAIYNSGLAMLAITMFLVGILDCVPNYGKRYAWAQSVLLMFWNFCFDFSIGPVCYVYISEVSATVVRSKTIAVATAVQAMVAMVTSVAIPYMINTDAADWRGKIGFFFGGLSALSLLWGYFRIPETKGRTYEELDIMFTRKVNTRDFATYRISE